MEKAEVRSYTHREELNFADCDCMKRVRPATLLRKAAAIAGYDYDDRGLTYEVLWDRGEVFLLSRLALRIRRCPGAGETLTVTTWENGVKGAHLQRVFEMVDEAGAVCVSIKSDWILVNPESRKILRPGAFSGGMPPVCPKEIDAPEPCKITLPKEGCETLGVRRVMWSDLDANGHLFSGNYGDIIWDYLPGDLQSRTVAEFFINYSHEAVLGQDLQLKGFREDNTYRMEGVGPDGVCFTALCVF